MTLMDQLQSGDLVTIALAPDKAVLRVRPGKDRAAPWAFERLESAGGDVVSDRDSVLPDSVVVVMKTADKKFVGFRSLFADGKVLQTTKEKGLVLRFANYNFESWEHWLLVGDSLSNCTLSNRQYPDKKLPVSISKVTVKAMENDKIGATKPAEETNGHGNAYQAEAELLKKKLEEEFKDRMDELEASLARQWGALLLEEQASASAWKEKHEAAEVEAKRERARATEKDALLAAKEGEMAEERERLSRLQAKAAEALAAEREELQRSQDAAVAKLAAEREEMKQSQAAMSAKLAEGTRDLEERQAKWKEAVDAWQKDFNKRRKELERERGEVTKQEAELSTREESVSEREAALEKGREKLRGEQAAMAEAAEKAEEERRAWEQRVTEEEGSKQRVAELEGECESLRASLAVAERQLSNHELLQNSLQESKDAAAAKEAKLTKKLKQVESGAKKLTAEAEARLAASTSAFETELRDLRASITSLEKECESALQTAAKAEATAAQLRANLTSADQSAELKEELAASQMENEELKSQLEDAQSELQYTRIQLDESCHNVSAGNDRQAHLNEQLRVAGTRVAELASALASAETRAAQLEAEQSEAVLRIQRHAQTRIEAVETIAAKADAEVLQLTQEKADLADALDKSLRSLAEKESQVDAANAAVEQATEERERLRKWLAEANAHLTAGNNDRALWTAEKQLMEEEADRLRQSEKSLSKEISDLKEEVNSLKTGKGQPAPEAPKKPKREGVAEKERANSDARKANGSATPSQNDHSKRTYRDVSRTSDGGGQVAESQKSALAQARAQLAESQRQVKALEAIVREKDGQMQAIEAQQRALEEQLACATDLTQELQAKIVELQTSLDSAYARNKELVDQLMGNMERLEEEKAALAREKMEALEGAKTTVASARESEADIERLREDVKDLRQQLQDKDNELVSMYTASAPAAATGSGNTTPRGSTGDQQPLSKSAKKKRRSRTGAMNAAAADQVAKTEEAAAKPKESTSLFLTYARDLANLAAGAAFATGSILMYHGVAC